MTPSDIIRRIKGKGRIRNHSSKALWVVESDTNHPHGPPVAHLLEPKHKSPKTFDADGFKRFDGKPISSHKHWWKIWGRTTADIYDAGSGLRVDVIYKRPVSEDHFGRVIYQHSKSWGVPIVKIIDTDKDKSGALVKFKIEGKGWVTKEEAILLTKEDIIDNAVLARSKTGGLYLRSKPDSKKSNNFSEMAKL